MPRSMPRAFEKRLKTDYGDFATVTDEEAQHVRDEVDAFIDACAEALERANLPRPDHST